MGRPPIGKEVYAKIRRLSAAGETDVAIAVAVGVSQASVSRYRKKLGLPSSAQKNFAKRAAIVRSLVDAGTSDIDTAAKAGLKKRTVRWYRALFKRENGGDRRG